MKQGQFPTIFQLADLNGKNGFKIDGESIGDYSCSNGISTADINGDDITDLLIGAVGHAGGIGRSYVIFGSSDIGSNETLLLSSLNGKNGFKLDGENSNDNSGYPVTAAGDINGDGYSDLLIGALNHNAGSGRSYLIFGGKNIGNGGLIQLSGLNGANGFKIDGENSGDWSGHSLAGIGDINGDGYADFVIGAHIYNNYTGRSYVVFGGSDIVENGLLFLSNINGSNGFKLDGESAHDQSGVSVSLAGDINNDGYPDLLIGADAYPGSGAVGRSYVIFGGIGIGSHGTLLLSSINGTQGFKLDGEANGDFSGYSYSISMPNDINGDGIADIVIGAFGHNKNTGRSYVVYGGSNIGSNALLPLSALNGSNGFKLDGENPDDQSGCSVSMIGDINGDGYGDLAIGAWHYNNSKGRSYVVFGGSNVSVNGIISLSNLMGDIGFKLDGESNDGAGPLVYPVGAAGDVNDDGIDDFYVAACGHPNTGRTYVIFGDIPPVFVNNSLSLYANETVFITPSCLAAYDRNHDNNTLVFIPSNVTHGQFELINNPGKAIANFTQQQISAGDIQFVPDGTEEAPSYNITVRTAGIAYVSETPANITFNLLQIKNNQLIINQDQTVVLTTDNLSAADTGGSEENIEFIISDLQHGQFQWINFPDQPIASFQQQNITDHVVVFVQDGSILPPSYNVTASNGKIIIGPQASRIDFDTLPVILNNTLRIAQGESVVLNSVVLSATHLGGDDANLMFMISNIQHGNFSVMNASLQPIFSFYQQNISDGQIQFNHDDSVLAPGYTVSVTDGRVSSPPQLAWIDFDAIPVLENNTLIINQGQQVILNSEILALLRHW